MYEINSKVQVLDRTNVWRNGVIIAKSSELYTIRFENAVNNSLKVENDYTSGLKKFSFKFIKKIFQFS